MLRLKTLHLACCSHRGRHDRGAARRTWHPGGVAFSSAGQQRLRGQRWRHPAAAVAGARAGAGPRQAVGGPGAAGGSTAARLTARHQRCTSSAAGVLRDSGLLQPALPDNGFSMQRCPNSCIGYYMCCTASHLKMSGMCAAAAGSWDARCNAVAVCRQAMHASQVLIVCSYAVDIYSFDTVQIQSSSKIRKTHSRPSRFQVPAYPMRCILSMLLLSKYICSKHLLVPTPSNPSNPIWST